MARVNSGFTTLRDFVSFGLGAFILVYTVVMREPPADLVAVGAGVTLAGFPVASLFVSGASRGAGPDDNRRATPPTPTP